MGSGPVGALIRLFNSGWALLVARGSLVFALAAVAILALTPTPPLVPGIASDKVEHFAAFFIIAILGAISWRPHSVALVVGFTVYGAALELLQGTSFIHRDISVFDWLVDTVGVLAGVCCAEVLSRRMGISRTT